MTKDKYELLFREHYRAMYRYAFTLLHDADDARDAVSEVWTRLLQTDAEVRVDTAEAYLKRLVHNHCVNVLEHKKVELKAQKILPQEMERTLNDDDVRERERRWNDVEQFISSQLSPKTQEILRLRYRDELSYKEMAERLDISTSAINKHITQALTRLRDAFRKT